MQSFPSNQITAVNTVFPLDIGPGWEYIRVTNESGYQLNVNLGALGNETVPAWQLMDIPCRNMQTGQIVNVGKIQVSALNLSDISNNEFPSSFFNVTCYLPGELSQPTNVSLTRLVSSLVSNATNVTNTGFGPGTIFIFGKPISDTTLSGPVVIENSGIVQFGDSQFAGQLTINNPAGEEIALVSSPSAQIFIDNSLGTQVFIVDNTGTITCANAETKITFGSGNETHIVNLAGSDIAFQSPAGTETGRITNSGIFKLSSQTCLQAGSSIDTRFTASSGHWFVFFNAAGTRVAHIDDSGNMIIKGTLTQNGTP